MCGATNNGAQAGVGVHQVAATAQGCFWGFFDRLLPPVLRVTSRDVVYLETLTHQAGDAPDLLMDDGEAGNQILAFLTRTKQLSRDDAYSAMSVAADFGVTQVVNIRQGVHCGIPKAVLLARPG